MKSMIFILVLSMGISTTSIVAFADGCDDAEILALQISGELLAPPLLYERIGNELAVIRQFYPGMELIHVLPPWVPGELIITSSSSGVPSPDSGLPTAEPSEPRF